jgi:rhodanese-related sulfurtransferase
MTRPQGAGESGAPASYAGDLSPKEAWELLKREKNAVLIDCRSQAEWSFVGVPDLSSLGKKTVAVEWQAFAPATADTKPRMVANMKFAEDVARAGVPKDANVVIICRSGGRSRSAAILMTQNGWQTCYNLAGGFEGPQDPAKHRGGEAGWKADGLPWTQE